MGENVDLMFRIDVHTKDTQLRNIRKVFSSMSDIKYKIKKIIE